MQKQWISSRSDCDVWWKSGFYTIASNDWLSGCTKKNFQITSQSQTWAKKWSWWLFGVRLLLVWCTTAFWIPGETVTSREVCSANQWDAPKTAVPCWWHWSIERPKFFSTVMLTAHHTTSASKVGQAVTKLCLISHIHLTTSSSISTTFCRENAS